MSVLGLLGLLLLVITVARGGLALGLPLERLGDGRLLPELLAVIGVLLVLRELQALEQGLEHLEGSESGKLERDGGEQLLVLELADDAVQLVSDVYAINFLEWRRVKNAPELLVLLRLALRQRCENVLEPVLERLGHGKGDPLLERIVLLLILLLVLLVLFLVLVLLVLLLLVVFVSGGAEDPAADPLGALNELGDGRSSGLQLIELLVIREGELLLGPNVLDPASPGLDIMSHELVDGGGAGPHLVVLLIARQGLGLLGLGSEDGEKRVGGVVLVLSLGFLREDLHEGAPQVHHVDGGHAKRRHEVPISLEPLHGHGGHGVQLDHLVGSRSLAVNDGRLLLDNIALQVDEPGEVLLKEYFVLGLGIDSGALDDGYVLVANLLEPVPELDGVSNGGGKGKDRAPREADDALERVSLGPVEGVDLVEDHVLEIEAAVEHDTLALGVGHHFLSGAAPRLGEGELERLGSADIDLRPVLGPDLLEGDAVRADGDIALEELGVGGCDLPHQDLGGKDEEDGTPFALTVHALLGAGVGGEQSLSRGGRGAHDGGLVLIDGGEDVALPGLELELAVVAGEGGQAIVHLVHLELDDVVLLLVLLHELPRGLEGVLVPERLVVVEGLENLGVGAEGRDLVLHLLPLLLLLVLLLVLVLLAVLPFLLRLLQFLLEGLAKVLVPRNLLVGGPEHLHLLEGPQDVQHLLLGRPGLPALLRRDGDGEHLEHPLELPGNGGHLGVEQEVNGVIVLHALDVRLVHAILLLLVVLCDHLRLRELARLGVLLRLLRVLPRLALLLVLRLLLGGLRLADGDLRDFLRDLLDVELAHKGLLLRLLLGLVEGLLSLPRLLRVEDGAVGRPHVPQNEGHIGQLLSPLDVAGLIAVGNVVGVGDLDPLHKVLEAVGLHPVPVISTEVEAVSV
mmetsp:Transcript_24451/g.45941  ORF Transcript_24451/g.45941 Transcript_24451/m.45941 type:complete len:911 (+) Transcript_24451:1662-4394(+)